MARKKVQAYTEEFRREAVKRSEKEGSSADLTPRFTHLHLEVPAIFLSQTYPEILSGTSHLMNCAA